MKTIEIFQKRLGEQNPVLIQLLGLCPLLAVSTKVSYALILGLSSTIVVVVRQFTSGSIQTCSATLHTSPSLCYHRCLHRNPGRDWDGNILPRLGRFDRVVYSPDSHQLRHPLAHGGVRAFSHSQRGSHRWFVYRSRLPGRVAYRGGNTSVFCRGPGISVGIVPLSEHLSS